MSKCQPSLGKLYSIKISDPGKLAHILENILIPLFYVF